MCFKGFSKRIISLLCAWIQLPDVQGTKAPTTLFTVDLGDVYSISRIRAAFGPSNLGLGQNKVKISVSADGQKWETPVTKGSLCTGVQYHQNVVRYELGVSYDTRYILSAATICQVPASLPTLFLNP